MGKAIMIVLFMFAWFPILGQTSDTLYYSASIDSIYLSQTSKFLTKEAANNCPVANISWTNRCNSPRTLLLRYTIRVNSKGKIESVVTNSAELNCMNEKGGTTKTILHEKHLFSDFEICQKQRILNLKEIKPLTLDGKRVNTEIDYIILLKL